MKDLTKIRARARRCRNDDQYDKWYSLALVQSGQFSELAISGQTLGSVRRMMDDLGDYPALNPPLGPIGQQNHGLVNSRINIQGIVHIDPDFSWNTDDATAKQVLDAQVRAWWEEAQWSDEFYQAGMEVEAFGIGFVEYGISSGRLNVIHRSVFDLLWDHNNRSPKDWRFFFVRVRLDLDDAMEKFGDAIEGDEKAKEEYLRRISVSAPRTFGQKSRSGSTRASRMDEDIVIHEWTYWDRDHYVCFLGSIQKGEAFVYDEATGKYKKATEATENPYGIIPMPCWIDSWVAGMKRPVGKTETTLRICTMLNEVENYCVQVLERGASILGVNTDLLDPELVDQLKTIKGSKDIARMLLLTGSGDIKQLLTRLDPLEVPETLIYFRSVLKEELNAATGVMDMQRGQALGGERRTKYEVNKLVDNQGVQARHTRERYARFLERCIGTARVVSVIGETVTRVLQLEDGVIDTAHFPIEPFLEAAIYPHCDPSTMYYKTDDERRDMAVMEFKEVDKLAIDYGVADPYRTFTRLYRRMGRRDPIAAGLFTPEEYQAAMQQKMLAEMLAGGEQNGKEGKSSDSGTGGNSGPPSQN